MLMFSGSMHTMEKIGKDVIVMCAIAGMIGGCPEDAQIHAMLRSMHHRGPDGRGVYRETDVCLLHTRLAIIDSQGGAQPMRLSWAGEHYVLL